LIGPSSHLHGYKPQIYYYAVRAVSPGNYKMGPVSADAMYNGEYHSYKGAGIIKVVIICIAHGFKSWLL
jgi:uncharacterized protein YfaS (alpha-2-macroglobulin family)